MTSPKSFPSVSAENRASAQCPRLCRTALKRRNKQPCLLHRRSMVDGHAALKNNLTTSAPLARCHLQTDEYAQTAHGNRQRLLIYRHPRPFLRTSFATAQQLVHIGSLNQPQHSFRQLACRPHKEPLAASKVQISTDKYIIHQIELKREKFTAAENFSALKGNCAKMAQYLEPTPCILYSPRFLFTE